MTDSLATYASTLAPETDHVFIAGHAAARPLVQALARQQSLSGFGILVDLRLPLLDAGGMSDVQARAIQRYIGPEQTRAGIDEAVARGFIERRGDTWSPTDAGQRVLDGLTAALAGGTAALWREQSAACARVTELAATVVDAAIEGGDRLPAFRCVVGGQPAQDAGASYVCWWSVAALRYLRADDHASAWEEVGLDAVGVSVLTHLCHNDSALNVTEIADRVSQRSLLPETLYGLRSDGLVGDTEGGWRVTEAGRRVRLAIEAATNQRNGARYRVLAANELSDLLESLRALRDN